MKTKEKNKLPKIDSVDLANYIIAKVNNVDHLKLQKLIYYIEGWHLGYFKKSLIDDEFEAWVHGPVSRRIWNKFKGASVLYNYLEPKVSLKDSRAKIKNQVNDSQFDLIDEVLKVYGKYSSFKLEEFTHSEKPWAKARKGLSPNEPSENLIDKKLMKEYFGEALKKQN